MLFRRRVKVSHDLIERYRNALTIGRKMAIDNERALYDIHLAALDELESALTIRKNTEEIGVLIWRERRSHGWSYLSGPYGGLATSLFHEIATSVEDQVYKIKGKEWYNSL